MKEVQSFDFFTMSWNSDNSLKTIPIKLINDLINGKDKIHKGISYRIRNVGDYKK